LKLPSRRYWQRVRFVAPFTGAWIEIRPAAPTVYPPTVAPFTGAWIEMMSIVKSLKTL